MQKKFPIFIFLVSFLAMTFSGSQPMIVWNIDNDGIFDILWTVFFVDWLVGRWLEFYIYTKKNINLYFFSNSIDFISVQIGFFPDSWMMKKCYEFTDN